MESMSGITLIKVKILIIFLIYISKWITQKYFYLIIISYLFILQQFLIKNQMIVNYILYLFPPMNLVHIPLLYIKMIILFLISFFILFFFCYFKFHNHWMVYNFLYHFPMNLVHRLFR